MKPKRFALIITVVVLFLCLFSVIAAGVGALYLQDQPPNSLEDSGYYIRRTKVFYYPGFGLSEPFEIEGADVDSFEVIDENYARDVRRVYHDGVPVSDSDPATFEIVDHYFARDSRHVYLNGVIHSNDPTNFENVAGNIYRDSQHIYWSTEPISDDPSNLVILDGSDSYTYFKDSTTIFIQGNPLQGADLATFSILKDAYSRDALHIFYFDQTISNADLTSFEIIDSPYARDAVHVYFMESNILDADPDTFQILNLNFQCAADATYAYYQGALIPGFDPASIPSDNKVTNCDANGIYFSP